MLGGHTLSLDAQLGHENVRSLDGKPIVVDKGASEGDRGGKSDREHDRANGLLRLSGFTTQSMRASDAKDIMSQAAKNEGVEDGLYIRNTLKLKKKQKNPQLGSNPTASLNTKFLVSTKNYTMYINSRQQIASEIIGLVHIDDHESVTEF
ncbi:hypothetical protein K4K61_008168 [Colletotrichum sp. SAR11_59]|nr:hypothetical protein K4K61_008168 [Colletotrichum sp. SAR11_59]